MNDFQSYYDEYVRFMNENIAVWLDCGQKYCVWFSFPIRISAWNEWNSLAVGKSILFHWNQFRFCSSSCEIVRQYKNQMMYEIHAGWKWWFGFLFRNMTTNAIIIHWPWKNALFQYIDNSYIATFLPQEGNVLVNFQYDQMAIIFYTGCLRFQSI